MNRNVDLNKQKYWADSIEKQRESMLSVEDWCRKHTVPISRFLVWEKRLAIAPTINTATIFEPVQLRPSSLEVTLTINSNVITCEKELLNEVLAFLK